MTPASLRPGLPSASGGWPEQGVASVASHDRKPSAKARGAGPGSLRGEAMAGLTSGSQRAPGATTSAIVAAPRVAPPGSPTPTLSVISPNKRPASLLGPDGPASASYAKKRASTRPYNEFCQELRPLLPARLRNAEREKLLGAAWKALSNEERHKFNAAGTPMPPPSQRGRGRRHGGTRVACDHAPARPLELQLAAPPAPPHQLAAPLAPHLQLAVLSRAPELQSSEFMLAAPPAPQLQLTSMAPPAAPQLQLAAPPAPPHQFDFDAVLSRAPELQLTAPPAPQLQLTSVAPPLLTMLQLTMAPAQLTMAQLTSVPAVPAPPQWLSSPYSSPPCSPPAPTAVPALWATRIAQLAIEVPMGKAGRVPMGKPGPLLDRRLPPLGPPPSLPPLGLPPSLQRLHEMYPALAAPFSALAAPPPPRAPQLLTAAAAHRTFVENFLGADQLHQQQLARVAEMMDLAEMMEQQMTGEDAMEIALSLGMPRASRTARPRGL